jgi:hypothetical protein
MPYLHTEYSTTGSTSIVHTFQEALLYSQPAASRNWEWGATETVNIVTHIVQCIFLIISASICQLLEKILFGFNLSNSTSFCYTIQLMHYSHFKTHSLQHLSIKSLHVLVFFHDHLQGVLRCALCHYYSSRWFAFVGFVLLHSMWLHVYVIHSFIHSLFTFHRSNIGYSNQRI